MKLTNGNYQIELSKEQLHILKTLISKEQKEKENEINSLKDIWDVLFKE